MDVDEGNYGQILPKATK